MTATCRNEKCKAPLGTPNTETKDGGTHLVFICRCGTKTHGFDNPPVTPAQIEAAKRDHARWRAAKAQRLQEAMA